MPPQKFFKVFAPTEKLPEIYRGGRLEPPKFMPTFYEWLMMKGQQILIGVERITTSTIYIVPDDYTLFILSANVSAGGFAGAPSSKRATIKILGTDKEILTATFTETSATNSSLSFPMPIKVNSKQIIQGYLEANSTATYSFQGFLVKNSEIPSEI